MNQAPASPPPAAAEGHLILQAHGLSDPGPEGKVNEDSWVIRETVTGGQLLVVCDGMGGMGRGDEASKLAANRLVERLVAHKDPGFEALIGAIKAVDDELREALCKEETPRQPGSTAAIAHVHEGRVTIGWVGDSSVLLIRQGAVVSRTRGHRLVQKLIETGEMSELDAKNSPMGRMLSRSLGGRPSDEETVKPGLLQKWVLQEDDHLILCSDGLTDFVPVDEIVTHLDGPIDAIPDRLVALAKSRDADDNITVVVARCLAAAPEAEHQIGASWAPPADPSPATLPPADYRSGILDRAELTELKSEPDSMVRRLQIGAAVVGLWLVLVAIWVMWGA